MNGIEDSLKTYSDLKNSLDTAEEKGRNEGREEGREEGRTGQVTGHCPARSVTSSSALPHHMCIMNSPHGMNTLAERTSFPCAMSMSYLAESV